MSNNKRINPMTGKPFKYSGYTPFAGTENDLPVIGLDVITVWAKRLKTIDGMVGANYVKFVGQQCKVRISSQMVYEIKSKERDINRKTVTIDIVDENGKTIGWEVMEMFFIDGINQ